MQTTLIVLGIGLLAGAAHAAPYDGVYFPSPLRAKPAYALISSGETVWVISKGLATAAHPKRQGAAWALSPGVTVEPAGRGWKLHAAGETLLQVDDPFFARVSARLKGQHVFALADPDRPHEKHHGTLTLLDGLFALVEDPDQPKACWAALLIPDPTENGANPQSLAPAQPTSVGARSLIIAKSPFEDCHASLTGAARVETHGIGGGAFVFAQKDGEILGLAMIGFLGVQLFVAKGHTAEELRAPFQALRR